MQIGGSFPIHIARAYGAGPIKPSGLTAPVTAIASPARHEQTPNDAVQSGRSIDRLVGGQVNQGVNFDLTSTLVNPAGNALQLYTRAADKIEAATGVLLGRSLDIRG